MSSIPCNLSPIRAFVLDVDGVLSHTVCQLGLDGIPCRTASVRDGFAIRMAVMRNYFVGVITGGNNTTTALRLSHLGVADFYNQSRDKVRDYEDFKARHGLRDEEIVYIGDDLPDLGVMGRCGLPVAPQDAAPEVLCQALYISSCKGGEGVVRDVIEQVLRAHGVWHTEEIELQW